VFTVRFLSKKITKPIFFYFKKTETGSNRPVSVRFLEKKPVQTDRFRFGFLEKKPVQTGLARFFRFGSVWLGFSGLTRFFSGFFSVRFGFFGSRLKKPKPNWSVFSKF
jgi:hypothetical protein